jgi:polyphosphate kinase
MAEEKHPVPVPTRTGDDPGGDGQAQTTPEVPFAVPTATAPRPVPKDVPLDHPTLYFNRELSWLDFNWRVLYQALDERTPLLERVRFLGITSSNLDEFFRKRVGGLKRQKLAGVRSLSPDGRSPQQQLDLIGEAVRPLYDTLNSLWTGTLRTALREEAGVHIVDYADLDARQQDRLDAYFRENIFPILTPLAVDPGHPFPFISNLSLSLAVILRHPARGTEHFARLKVPRSRGRWVPLEERHHVVPLEQIIKHNVDELFRGMEIVHAHAFRITRNADIRRDEEEADDLLEMISEELRERRFAPVVRLEVEDDMPRHVRQLLLRELQLDAADVYDCDGLLDYADCMALADLDVPAHRYESWEPVIPTRLLLEGETQDAPDIFTIIRRGDLLVHHPYESFNSSVLRFVEEAADDPNVLAIKQTLYRTSDESPVMGALIRAAEHGKQVAVLVEVKARFDEQNNIEWGQMLEKSGVHVTYGLVGLKTHAKTTLVIREENGGLRTYCHIGTGNYNPQTARLYTDFGLLTCNPDLGYDVTNLFHYLTGYAPEQHYRELIVAPREMRQAFEQLIEDEVRNQREHGNGRIIAKMNGLDDVRQIQQLYRASQEGVEIDLIVRGHSRLRPGLPGFSDNIRVMSVIGRFLEHSRVYYFHNNGTPKLFFGSADWRRRNLDDRVEAIVPIRDATARARLLRLLQFILDDQRQTWDLHPDGRYTLRHPSTEEEAIGLHDLLMRRAQQRINDADRPWDIR